MSKDITSIEEHELRSVWPHEEQDFTVWLTNNIDLLTSEIGIEIEDISREEAVGDFAADIVGTEMNTGRPVVIENQYNSTNHDHLGKLLTYSAGKDAGFTIWLAEEFRPEHRSVLEWLNESGPKDVRFFGIKPRVISIEGASKKGFEFEVLVEPNDWERELTDELTETERAYLEFYEALTEGYSQRRPDWYKLAPQPQSWLVFGAGIGGISLGWSFHKGPEFATELYIDTSDKERNEAIYRALKEDREEIEANLDEDLVWQRLPEKRACRIKQARAISSTIRNLSEEERTQLIEWGINNMDQFQDEFKSRVSRLDPPK